MILIRGNILGDMALLRYDYNSETGFFWRKPGYAKGRGQANKPAGTQDARGYVAIMMAGKRVLAHQLAWYFVHREWLTKEIDHINCDPSDNRIINLRRATAAQNLANRRVQRNNTSGIKGVTRHRQKWAANISVLGRSVYLGVYDDKAAATRAYREAATKYYGDFARVE